METCQQYQQWNQNELNNRILALYDQIEQVTLQNLEVAQKNCELEIQIKTIDDIVQSFPTHISTTTLSTNRSQQLLENKYDNLLQDHKKLINRVNKIEEVLFASTKKKSIFTKQTTSTIGRVTSIQDIVAKGYKRTATKIKNDLKESGVQHTSRRQETTKKTKYF